MSRPTYVKAGQATSASVSKPFKGGTLVRRKARCSCELSFVHNDGLEQLCPCGCHRIDRFRDGLVTLVLAILIAAVLLGVILFPEITVEP